MSVIWDGFVSEMISLEKLFDPESKIQRDDDRSVEQVSETVKTLTEWKIFDDHCVDDHCHDKDDDDDDYDCEFRQMTFQTILQVNAFCILLMAS